MRHLKLYEEFNIDYYEHGRCEIFALALHKTLGYDMHFFLDEEAEFETEDGFEYGTALVHAYVKDKDGNMFDATGRINQENLEEDHSEYVNEPSDIIVDENLFRKFINDGFIADYKEHELNKVIEYIINNISKYK
jgi:hypothetical protein